jgi:hypothetical protein
MTGNPLMVALLISAASLASATALAEPLDKEACAKLQIERKVLLTPEMQAALDRGPDWVKKNLDEAKIERVRHFLSVEELIQFRCRGGGVNKKQLEANASGGLAPGTTSVPLPDRNPSRVTQATQSAQTEVDSKPSQALADSDKTPPGKAKATR